MSKSIKKEMRAEFARIIPNVLPAVLATPVTRVTSVNEETVYKRFNFRMAFATLCIVFFVTLASGGGFAYSNPNTYLTITFSPETINNMLQNLSTNEEEVNYFSEDGVEYTLTLGVNSFDYVVDIDADNDELKESINNLNVKNKNLSIALASIMNYAQNNGMIDLAKKESSVYMNILTNYESRSERIESYLNSYLVDRGAPKEAIFVNPGMQVPFFQAPQDVINNMPRSPFESMPMNMRQETYGRVAVINEIMDINNNYKEEDLTNVSNRELAHILMEVKKEYNKRIPHN